MGVGARFSNWIVSILAISTMLDARWPYVYSVLRFGPFNTAYQSKPFEQISKENCGMP